MEIKQIAQYDTKTRKNSNRFRVYDTDGLAPTLGGMGGGGREPWILIASQSLQIQTGNTKRVTEFTIQNV